jgi:hypothetical protein
MALAKLSQGRTNGQFVSPEGEKNHQDNRIVIALKSVQKFDKKSGIGHGMGWDR